jgi:hypothetical protein
MKSHDLSKSPRGMCANVSKDGVISGISSSSSASGSWDDVVVVGGGGGGVDEDASGLSTS